MKKNSILGNLKVLFMSLLVWSNLSGADVSDFEKLKMDRMTEIDRRIQKLQEHRSCVSNANSFETLRQCGEEMRVWRRSEINERRPKRDERKKGP